MQADIIVTGSEFLLGETVDTNSAYIARHLRDVGIDVAFIITVGDDEQNMILSLEQSLSRSDLVITTGGLGPTVDDVTRPAVAGAIGRELIWVPELLTDIEAFFVRRGRDMTENNRRQAYIPAGAIPIHNPVGTAPAFIVEDMRGTIICLPGVPHEMEYLMQNEVLPYLRRRAERPVVIRTRTLHTCGIGESNVDAVIGDVEQSHNPVVGLAAHPGQTDIRITARGADEAEAVRLLDETEAEIRRRLGDVIFGVDDETLEGIIAEALEGRGESLAILETNTAGELAERLRRALEARGAGHLLRLARTLPAGDRPPSEEYVAETARALAQEAGAHWVLCVVGAGGPEQGISTDGRGRTCMAIQGPEWPLAVLPFRYGGEDAHGRGWIIWRGLDTLRRALKGLPLRDL